MIIQSEIPFPPGSRAAHQSDHHRRTQLALVDLARSRDPDTAGFAAHSFRERHYRYAGTSFPFRNAVGAVQYPPALVMILSELVASVAAP